MPIRLLNKTHRRNSLSVIKAGSYEDLCPHLQQAIDKVKERVERLTTKIPKQDNSSLFKRIEDILSHPE